MNIKSAMSHPPRSIGPTATIAEAAKIMRREGIGALPVTEGTNLVGILTDRDICCRAVAQGLDSSMATVGDVMSPEVATCFDDQDLYHAAALMEAKKIMRVAITDRQKRLVGMLTLSDLSRHVSSDLVAEVERVVSWR